jgi:DNA-binding LacI/PurR family transcriptional regulator
MPKRTSSTNEPKVTLKTLAEHLHLTAGTISAALNDSAAARAIPEHTKRRILEAARELNYKPNYFARSLRLQRTYTIGVIAQQIGDPYGAAIISGIEEYLRNSEYFFLTGDPSSRPTDSADLFANAAGARCRGIHYCRYIN